MHTAIFCIFDIFFFIYPWPIEHITSQSLEVLFLFFIFYFIDSRLIESMLNWASFHPCLNKVVQQKVLKLSSFLIESRLSLAWLRLWIKSSNFSSMVIWIGFYLFNFLSILPLASSISNCPNPGLSQISSRIFDYSQLVHPNLCRALNVHHFIFDNHAFELGLACSIYFHQLH